MPLDAASMDSFIEALRTQRGLYDRMMEMTELQIERLAKDNAEGIEIIVKEKQVVLDEIDVIDARIRPIKENWESLRGHIEALGGGCLERAEQALHAIRDTLGKLIELENRWKDMLDERQQQTRAKLSQLERGRRMNNAYGVREPRDPRYWDEKK